MEQQNKLKMNIPFEDYLINVGVRSSDYTYTIDQLFGNTEYFKSCYDDGLSAYKALLFFNDYLRNKTISPTGPIE